MFRKFLIIPFIMSINTLFAQEMPMSTVLDYMNELVKFDNHYPTNYDDSISVEDFDFSLFNSRITSDSNIGHYQLFYNDGKLDKISRYHETLNFDLFLYEVTDLIFYSLFYYESLNRDKDSGVFVPGVFVYDKKEHINLLFKFSPNKFNLVSKAENNYSAINNSLLSLDSVVTSDIIAIYELNDSLFPSKKTIWFEDELLTLSKHIYGNENKLEEMIIYAKKTCEINISLNRLSLRNLYNLLSEKVCHDGLRVFTKPISSKTLLPDWIFRPSEYW